MTCPSPLVPVDCDLRDFLFTPMEFQRLFSSETWLLSNSDEKVAAITLWGICWTQVPAGSIPADERLLAHLSGAGSRWKKVRAMALRGWVLCDDGRYYHPVMCEKVLEAWMEKVSARAKSAAGNAKRWGAQANTTGIAIEYHECRRLLAALNPKSRALQKSIPAGLLEVVQNAMNKPAWESHGDSFKDSNSDATWSPSGIPQGVPQGVPVGSQGTGTGTGNIKSTAAARGEASGEFPGQPASDAAGVVQVGKVPMAEDWCPGDTLPARLVRAGMSPDADTPAARQEFIGYWRITGGLNTPAQWDHKYFQRLQQNHTGGQYGKSRGAAPRLGAGGQSLSERVRAANGIESIHDA